MEYNSDFVIIFIFLNVQVERALFTAFVVKKARSTLVRLNGDILKLLKNLLPFYSFVKFSVDITFG